MIDRHHKLERRLHRDREPHRYCSFETSAESTTQANTTTTNSDLRVAGGNSSTNVSAQNSTVSLVDAGAVQQAFGFAHSALDAAVQGITTAEGDVKAAYSEAKAGEQKILVGLGLIIIGVVAVAALKGKV